MADVGGGCRHYPIVVKRADFRSVLEQYRVPRYLNVDIEGADRLCVEDLGRDIAPPYISVEATDIGLPDLLAEKGYALSVHQPDPFLTDSTDALPLASGTSVAAGAGQIGNWSHPSETVGPSLWGARVR